MFEDTIPYYKQAFRIMRRMEEDGKNYRRERDKKGPSKGQQQPGQISQREPRIRSNKTAEQAMRQRIGNEDWKTAREKLLAGREYAFEQKKYKQGPRPRDIQNAIKKQLARKKRVR